ncbi:hypothetical protein KIN_23420 [Litoreibacter roseus]|uniref:Uncharacterized protein n=1 Tax=Litoreibacter roseus TaxID=2601869 RepID=A0A6N6JJ16_9RHOB|nr:hypothetical protein KIN_23420 [Litoreibacter roseus]
MNDLPKTGAYPEEENDEDETVQIRVCEKHRFDSGKYECPTNGNQGQDNKHREYLAHRLLEL